MSDEFEKKINKKNDNQMKPNAKKKIEKNQ
jgi:hypothetical protein